jgi:hypothetical protein
MPGLACDLEHEAVGEACRWLRSVLLQRGANDFRTLNRQLSVVEQDLNGAGDVRRAKPVRGSQHPDELHEDHLRYPGPSDDERLRSFDLPGVVADREANDDVRVNGPHAGASCTAGFPPSTPRATAAGAAS